MGPKLAAVLTRATDLFPLWALLCAAAAVAWPNVFAPLRPIIVPLLGVVMFGMGITLRGRDFAAVLRRPAVLLFGTALQFGLMPAIGWGIAQSLGLSTELSAGLVLVGSCPGGTASNVICYLARADVALSIALTTISTLLAVVATPLLTELYVGRSIEVDVGGMILSIVRIVLVPVALGVMVNTVAGRWLGSVKRVFPLLSVVAIVVIIAIVIALANDRLRDVSLPVLAAVALHNGLGLVAGYAIPRGLGVSEAQSRTLAIEVGMQNSGLGVALAMKYFSPLAALPGALFSIWHNLTGSLLAAAWSRRAP